LRETVEGVKNAGGAIATHLCDVTRAEDVAAMVEACVKAYGRVDVLVNNVGGSAAGGPVEMSEETWDAQGRFQPEERVPRLQVRDPGDGEGRAAARS